MDVPAMISRIKDQGSYWDNPLRQLSPSDDLRFIDFYDFDESGYRDLQYCQVEITSSPQHPEVVGHLALIEVRYLGAVLVGGPTPA